MKSNFGQRGIGNSNPIKLGRCIKELAEMIGISVDTLNNYKKLTELVPKLQDWVETGISASTKNEDAETSPL